MTDHRQHGFRFDLRELNGALGDIGTLLPLTVGMIAIVGLSAQAVLIGFGLFYIATGLIYRLPVPVQPMKTIAAVSLISAATPAAIALSGVSIGLVLLFLGSSGLIDRIARLVPQSVLSGLQLGLGLALASIAMGLMRDQWIVGGLTLTIAYVALRFGAHAALLTIGAGVALGLGIGHSGWPELAQTSATGWFPLRDGVGDIRTAMFELALPQLALTLTNAIFLTAFVAQDLFGRTADSVTPRSLCLSSGAANLLCAPFGALPMCHGAGGLAAHHRFGARTGAAPVMIGTVALLVACLPADVRSTALSAIPAGTLGALLLIAAAELALSRRLMDALPSCRPVIAATALGTVLINPLTGLLVGTLAEIVRKRIVMRRRPSKRQGVS